MASGKLSVNMMARGFRIDPKTRSWNGRKKAQEAQNKRLFPEPVPGFFFTRQVK